MLDRMYRIVESVLGHVSIMRLHKIPSPSPDQQPSRCKAAPLCHLKDQF